MTTSEHLIEWLKERRNNCLRIAMGKTGADRDGWLEDAEYFAQALILVESQEAGKEYKL